MTIFVPKDFKLQDSKPAPQYLDENSKPITDSAVIKLITKDNPIPLLAIESLDKKNTMEINLIPITKTLTQVMGDSTEYAQNSKKFAIAVARQATEKFDTVFAKIKIDKFVFDKIFTVANIRGEDYYSGAYTTKIGNYYLAVSMFFVKGKKGDELIHIIETAKFE